IVELLSRPTLTELPENPVGKVRDELRSAFLDFSDVELPEIVELSEARKTIGDEALYIEPHEVHRIDDDRILRYDLTLPLLMNVRHEGKPLHLWAAGKAYRRGRVDSQHLEAFHQAEVFALDEKARLDVWQLTAMVLHSVSVVLPGRTMKIVPTNYQMCSQ